MFELLQTDVVRYARRERVRGKTGDGGLLGAGDEVVAEDTAGDVGGVPGVHGQELHSSPDSVLTCLGEAPPQW